MGVESNDLRSEGFILKKKQTTKPFLKWISEDAPKTKFMAKKYNDAKMRKTNRHGR